MITDKKRFILIATSFSDPGTMGGNTKIAIETVRHLSAHIPVVVIVPDKRLPTLTDNIVLNDQITVYTTKFYTRNPRLHPFGEAFFYLRQLKKLFAELNVSASDYVFTSSDFLYDALPLFLLKKAHRFTWITSNFLFVPAPLENLLKRYTFPFFLYVLAYIYQRAIFRLIKWRGDLFVITNDCDRAYYPQRLQSRVFAFYGGVNVEQIEAIEKGSATIRYDMMFCSRLHQQKGLDQFLDIWKRVVQKCPRARLAVIGSGAPYYERYLHRKAERLGIAGNVEWMGYVNNEEKFRLYRASRFFVHPTVYDNNGMVAAEALCTGLRTVMNDLPSLRDVYVDGCAKSDFSDKAATANIIAEMLSSPDPYRLPKDVVQKYRQRWDWRNRVQSFEQFLVDAGAC
ncbi:MAG: glycosyltransferase [Kiritimatiellaeota bacterium]|nr:glycosyltransferase [Kiritimatiellota bacterium]